MKETQNESPFQTSRHSIVGQEICLFSKFLYTIRENLNSNEISETFNHDLQRKLAWFIIDYFVHDIDLIALSRKNFLPQNSDNQTVIADELNNVFDPDWSHPSFIKITTDMSSQATTIISNNKDHVRITLHAIDAKPLNYNTIFTDRTGNKSLNFQFIFTQENFNGTRNPTQQDIQTPSHFINEELVETMPTTKQQSVSPIHPTLTTPKTKIQHLHKRLYNPQ